MNQIEQLKSVIKHCEERIDWMNRPDQDDDYVVCGMGWKAVQEKRSNAARWISDLERQGYYINHDHKTGYTAYCKDNEQIAVRYGKWGMFAIIDGKCYSDKKMRSLGWKLKEETLKVDIDGNESWIMI